MNRFLSARPPGTGLQNPAAKSPLARKLAAYVVLSDTELEILAEFEKRKRRFSQGHDLIYEGQGNQSAYILSDGWACSYKLLPNGSRQIVDFQIPGDFLGLRSMLLRTADHNVEPVTVIEASEITSEDLIEAFSATPRIATAILWATSRDEAMVVEHLVNLGRRDAAQRTVHCLLELGMRLRLVGIGTASGYACPLSQYLLADALGLSAVHVNRVLRQLREDGLLTFQKGKVEFLDLERLIGFADFDRTYLDQEGPILT